MAKTNVMPRKKRGPAPTGKGTQIQVRLQPDQLTGLDAWIEKQEIKPTRPEAIRGMIDAMLHIPAKDPGEKQAKKADKASRAAELAATQIEKMIDPTTPAQERAKRRRRLTKGPEEFREMRVDRPKAKGK
jgi:hypothetical protein